jgi:hypothetical protein
LVAAQQHWHPFCSVIGRGAPRLLREHTREILADVLGYSSSQIDALDAWGAAAPKPR